LECIGITNAADSLAAIQKLVYEDKTVGINELCEALLADFEGYESLRQQCLAAPKFGNDIEKVDIIRQNISEHLFTEIRSQPSIIGGHYIPGEVIFTAHGHQGEKTGATPDGRRKGQVLADSAGAMQGADMYGSTALMNSALKIPTADICTSIALNMKFLRPSFVKNKEKIKHLFKAFIALGGQQLQVNVCDREILLDALQNPENHKNLIVRVGGYSEYFYKLPQNLQEEITKRSVY
jgi:formate C-acetyltransferase